jgi:transposase-like protein
MAKAYSVAFKKQMVERLVGAKGVSAGRLARETGVSQEALSRWLRDARNVPPMPKQRERSWSLEEKVTILAAGAKLEGEELLAYLRREGVEFATYESWRLALSEGGTPAKAATRRIRDLERELARKEKALAEAAALLILKKKVATIYGEDADEDTDEDSEK